MPDQAWLVEQMQERIFELSLKNDELQVEYQKRSTYLAEVTAVMAKNTQEINALQTALNQMGVPSGEEA